MKLLFLLLSVGFSLATTAAALGFKGTIEFTADESAAHRKHIGTITAVARQHLEKIWSDHNAFYQKYRVSKFYGDRNLYLDTRNERIAALRQAGAPVSLVDQLKPTSCIGLSLDALKAGFNAPGDANLSAAWQKIYQFARANALDGCSVLHALQKLGWQILYWNPSPQDNERWDREDGTRRSRGWHAYRYLTVNRYGTYYFNKVDDKTRLVGFGTTLPAEFRSVPFFVGVAHTGYHVFPGFAGDIIEAHSTRRLNSFDNLEKSSFNPLKSGGGPRWTSTEKYRSGLIAIPPK